MRYRPRLLTEVVVEILDFHRPVCPFIGQGIFDAAAGRPANLARVVSGGILGRHRARVNLGDGRAGMTKSETARAEYQNTIDGRPADAGAQRP